MNFSLVVATGNASEWIGQCLRSIAGQKTRWDWQCLVIDDASTDGTSEVVTATLSGIDPIIRDRFAVRRNPSRLGALTNLVGGFAQLGVRERPMDVLIPIDGDDWLFSSSALETIATAYEQHHCWLTYGGLITSPGGDLCTRAVEAEVIRSGTHRQSPWLTSHLRSFRSHLWHAIRDEDLRDENGHYFDVTWDMAMMFPMLEMAAERIHCVTKAVYVYNTENVESDHIKRKPEQLAAEQHLRSRPPYQRLSQAMPCNRRREAEAHLGFLVLCGDDPSQTTSLLQSLSVFYGDPPVHLIHRSVQRIGHELPFDQSSRQDATFWGGQFPQVDALLNGLEKAANQWRHTEWIAILDDECHPLIDANSLLEILRSSHQDGFLHAEAIIPDQLQSTWQATCWQRFGGDHGHHPFSEQLICYAGSPWMILRRSAIHYLLRAHQQQTTLKEHYRRKSSELDVPATDESYVHTLLCNQPGLNLQRSPICWEDWSEGWPRVLQAEDSDQLQKSGLWFAKRFRTPNSTPLLDRLHGSWMLQERHPSSRT